MAEVKRIYLVVTGKGEVPFDMLRYDCCFPDSPEDAARMHVDWTNRNYTRAIILAKYDKMGGFTPARWSSFGWGAKEFRDDRYLANQHCQDMNKAFQIVKEVKENNG